VKTTRLLVLSSVLPPGCIALRAGSCPLSSRLCPTAAGLRRGKLSSNLRFSLDVGRWTFLLRCRYGATGERLATPKPRRRRVGRLLRPSVLRLLSSAFVLSSVLCPLSSVFAQGSLTPPGPPAPTMKTLDQVKPGIPIPGGSSGFTISAAGSYYLTGNLTLATGNAIQVNASSVNIDLNGFVITGPGKNAGTGTIGISGATASNVNVRNGKILQFPSDGIRLAPVAVVEDMMVESCGAMGINLGEQSRVERCRVGATTGIGVNVGDSSIVHSCIVIGSASYGIKTGLFCQVLQSVSNYNSAGGIFASNGAVLRDCMAAYNNSSDAISGGTGSALHNCAAVFNTGSAGIKGSYGSTLENCAAAGNTVTYGIHAVDGSTLINCSALANNAIAGIYAVGFSTLTNCSANENTATYGMQVTRSALHNCVASGNTGGNASSYGIYASFSSVLAHCSAYNNGNSAAATADSGVGIYASASTIKDCTAGVNKGDGIQVLNNCTVEGNTSYVNGNGGDGAGIHATANSNRIENNNVVGNDRGIDVTAVGNLIIKNSAKANTNNYNIVIDNRYGPIVDLTAGGTAAVSGNSAAGTTVNADPQANFAY
jgi:hypothetical protein